MQDYTLAPEARSSLINKLGDQHAQAWEEQLPSRLEAVCRQQELAPERNLPGSTRGLVVVCRGNDRRRWVVKISFLEEELAGEHRALQVWAGHPAAMIRPHCFLPQHSALVLPLIGEGRSVDERQTDADAEQVAALIDSLACLPDDADQLPGLREDVEGRLEKCRTRLPQIPPEYGLSDAQVGRARSQLAALCASAERSRLVHGDMYPGNVLMGPGGSLLACDPKGLLGDRHFDAAMWCLKADEGHRFDAWLAVFRGHGYDAERLQAWVPIIALHEVVAYICGRKKLWNVDAMLAWAAQL